jgi:hypothetical protein
LFFTLNGNVAAIKELGVLLRISANPSLWQSAALSTITKSIDPIGYNTLLRTKNLITDPLCSLMRLGVLTGISSR